jgi:murein L,D-transpeptidase YafK
MRLAPLLLVLAGCGADQTMPSSAEGYRGPRNCDRPANARSRATDALSEYAAQAGLSSPVPRIVFVAYKYEDVLEAHGAADDDAPFVKLASWPVLAASGGLGPKRREGDRQVPEGLFHIDRFNPRSSYYLSLGINYPNDSDRILGHPETPGGDIFIHGDQLSIGCLAMGDAAIEEIYTLAEDARRAGQSRIPVLIFPFRPGSSPLEPPSADAKRLWESLALAHEVWEAAKRPPKFSIGQDGAYVLKGS